MSSIQSQKTALVKAEVDKTVYHYNEWGKLTCVNCGSHRFVLGAELVIYGVAKIEDGEKLEMDPESISSLVCAECGYRIK